MGLFDGLAAAFANDDTLGERESAPKAQAYSIKWIGPKGEETLSQALPGQKIKDLARQAGVAGKIKYNCGEGTCSSCDMLVNGDRVPACLVLRVNSSIVDPERKLASASRLRAGT